MMRDLRETKTNRRKFLRDIATAGGLAAVAGSAGATIPAETPERSTNTNRRPGYRVTAHVAKYYDKARF